MNVFLSNCESVGWSFTLDEYGDSIGKFGEVPDEGEMMAQIYVADYTGESLGGIVIQFGIYVVPAAGFPSESINNDLTALGISASVPAFSGSASGYTYYEYDADEGYAQVMVSVAEGEEESSASAYENDLLSAGYTYTRQDYGFNVYTSSNGELEVCAWYYASSYPGTFFIDITPVTESE